MSDLKTVIPGEWNRLDILDMQGVIMVIGRPDTGKSTLARHLFTCICLAKRLVAFLDGDPGQSTLGPPTTITIALSQPGMDMIPADGQRWSKFIASTSPRGHMLLMLSGAGRLVAQAISNGHNTVVYDTSGLVDAAQGGQALKFAKIDLLEPSVVIAIQEENELEPLLGALKSSGRTEVVTLAPSPAVIGRDLARRQDYRARKFAAYFSRASKMRLDWRRYAIFPAPRFAINRLLALEDRDGFVLGLGIVTEIDRIGREVELLTPLVDFSKVRSVYLGSLLVDPVTFRDQQIG